MSMKKLVNNLQPTDLIDVKNCSDSFFYAVVEKYSWEDNEVDESNWGIHTIAREAYSDSKKKDYLLRCISGFTSGNHFDTAYRANTLAKTLQLILDSYKFEVYVFETAPEFFTWVANKLNGKEE